MRGEATLERDNFSSKISVDIGKKKRKKEICVVCWMSFTLILN